MAKAITSKNYDGEAMTLVDEATFQPIMEGDVRASRDGETHRVVGGRAPHKPESSGKVWVRNPLAKKGDHSSFEFYPSVIKAKWTHDATLKAHAAATSTTDAVAKLARPKRRRR